MIRFQLNYNRVRSSTLIYKTKDELTHSNRDTGFKRKTSVKKITWCQYNKKTFTNKFEHLNQQLMVRNREVYIDH